ncbi:MAG: ribosome recycling factor [Chloroflexi bacterium]|nr:ribosome recycling factor [Chloroflexota bacterium]
MINDALRDAEGRMRSAINSLQDDMNQIRTGRASPALVEKLPVEYYGTPTPLMQLANISAPEPQMILIQPYDKGIIAEIERAIQNSDLSLSPNTDGQVIRLILPPLNEERRRDLTKLVAKRVEEAKVAVRNIRRDVLEEIREYEKEKLISEDDFHRGKDDLQKVTDKYIGEVEDIARRKEKEIMEV